MVEKNLSSKEKKISLSEHLWLCYLNQYLFENGIISESQRNKIKNKIDCRKPSTHYCNKSLNNDYIKE